MNTIALTRSILAVALLVAGARAAHAQQLFEDKYVTARPTPTELVGLPTLGIVPAGTAPLDVDVAAQLTEAVQKELDSTQETRFEVITRANGAKVNWAFVVRNAPRAMHDAFTPQLTDQLITCLHALPDDVNLASLNILLVGGQLGDQGERDEANAAGAQMLVHWKADQCVTRRNNLPFIDSNRPKLTAATRGMLTDVFDPLIFHGQGLLDLIAALYPVYFNPGGFWATEMTPRLHELFEAGVGAGLLTTVEVSRVADRELRTFWDWAIQVVATKLSVVRPFVEVTANACTRTLAELSASFKLARCVADGKLALVTLRVAGQDYIAAHRVLP